MLNRNNNDNKKQQTIELHEMNEKRKR